MGRIIFLSLLFLHSKMKSLSTIIILLTCLVVSIDCYRPRPPKTYYRPRPPKTYCPQHIITKDGIWLFFYGYGITPCGPPLERCIYLHQEECYCVEFEDGGYVAAPLLICPIKILKQVKATPSMTTTLEGTCSKEVNFNDSSAVAGGNTGIYNITLYPQLYDYNIVVFGGICITYGNENKICHGDTEPLKGIPPTVIPREIGSTIVGAWGRVGLLIDQLDLEQQQYEGELKSFKTGGHQGKFENASPTPGRSCVLKYISGSTTSGDYICSINFHWSC